MNDLSTALGRVRNSLASNLGADGVLVLTKGDVAEVLALINQTANPQGEQVAWHTDDHLTDKSATTYDRNTMERWKAKGWPVQPLYAEQPAPVAVLPERRIVPSPDLDAYKPVDAASWNACLDEMKRLNPSL